MGPSLIKIRLKTAEKNSAQTNRRTNRHYENSHLAVNQLVSCLHRGSHDTVHVLLDRSAMHSVILI